MTANMADRMPFSKLMGVEVVEATRDKVTATLVIRPDLCTAGHIMHGGAVMAFADAVGAIGAVLNLPEGKNLLGLVQSFEIALTEVLESADALASEEVRLRASDFSAQ